MDTAPDAIRLQSSIFKDHFDHYDFDFNELLLANRQVRIVDCGDVDKQANGGMQNPERIIDDALLFGSVFIRAREVHRKGIHACIDKVPAADHYLITIDADAPDTAIAPGVLFPTPGGLSFDETTDLVRKIASKGPIVGICLFEVRPERDINGLTASTAAQLIINFIGTMARSGQIGG